MSRRGSRIGGRSAVVAGDSAVVARTPRQKIVSTLPYSYIRADSYTVDGVTGKVASLTDCVAAGTGIKVTYPTHELAQSNTAYQVALPAASAVFGGLSVLTMATAMYITNALAGAFNFMHNGAGFKMYLVASADSVAAGVQYILATSTTAGQGHNFTRTSSSFSNVLYSATPAVIGNITDGGMAADTAHVLAASYLEGASPELGVQVGSGAATTGDTSAAPGGGDASALLRLGCRLTANSPWVGKFATMLLYNRIPTAAEDALVRAALFAEYGAS